MFSVFEDDDADDGTVAQYEWEGEMPEIRVTTEDGWVYARTEVAGKEFVQRTRPKPEAESFLVASLEMAVMRQTGTRRKL
jgi:hypothetical protein